MITTKFPEYLQAVDDAIEDFYYGDIISIEWLYVHFDLHPPKIGTHDQFKTYQLKFLSAMDGFRELLLTEHKIMLQNVRGEGYLLVNPNEQTQIAWDKLKTEISRQINKAEAKITNINMAMLSDKAKQHNIEHQAKLSTIKAFNKQIRKEERHRLG